MEKHIENMKKIIYCPDNCLECEYWNSVSLECEKPESIDVDTEW